MENSRNKVRLIVFFTAGAKSYNKTVDYAAYRIARVTSSSAMEGTFINSETVAAGDLGMLTGRIGLEAVRKRSAKASETSCGSVLIMVLIIIIIIITAMIIVFYFLL
jgi:hypothetical protein